jgi:hypothetical protein
MASTINSDNGVVSGSVGLKYASDNSGVLALQTNGNTAITITSTGNVGVGNTSPTSKLTVGGAIESLVDQQGGSAEGGQLVLRAPVGGTKRWNVDNYQNQLRFFNENDSDASSGSVALTVTANGILSLAGASTAATGTGITFPSTQVASSDPNTLDDYEEGTWTPTITTNSGTSTTYSDLGGRYTKIGNIVYIRGGVRPTNGTFGAGSACTISGLPFTGGSQSPRAGTFSGCNASLYYTNQLAVGAVEGTDIYFVMSTAITLNNLFTFSGTYSITAS